MGEGRSERSGKRQRSSYGIDKSSSDSELARARHKERKAKSKGRWPFFEGLTVDELVRYRRRRVPGHPKDNLGLFSESDIVDKNLLSEYRRAFRTSSEEQLKENISPVRSERPKDLLQLDGSYESVQPLYREDFKEYENVEFPLRKKEPPVSLVLVDEDRQMETETESSKFIAHANPVGRSPLIRRGTSLKREGDFYADTEMYSSYVPYEGQHRAELMRRPTSLKMEGDLDTMTEKCEKFIEWLNVSRPELMRVPTHLKLEGEFEVSTENQDKYVPFVGARRPELLRQSTNLKLEGESNFVPEYTDVFKQHNVKGKHIVKKPEANLKAGGDFFLATESSDNFVHPRAREAQLMSELARDVEEEERRRKEQTARGRKEEEMKMLVSRLEGLKAPPLEIPEYKDAYKDLPRERPKIMKPDDEIGRADGSKVPSPTHSKFNMKIDQDPEYKSKYLDYSRDRPIYRKPPLALRPTVVPTGRSSAGFGKPIYQDSKRCSYEPTSEVRSQYIPYGHVPRVETLRMPANLRLEGNIDLQPEYRNAYCTQRDYQACNEPRMHRRRDRSLSASKRKENYWINNNNDEQFNRVKPDQNAFQVLYTRVHEENVVGKPPSDSRRGSRTLQVQSQRPAQLDTGRNPDSIILKNRSPSPTYRLHVCNVDDEPRGFGRRKRSPSFQSSGRIRTPSPDHLTHETRPYSPSFGRDKQQVDRQSFVVLDNTMHSNLNEGRRKRIDRNSNVNGAHMVSRGRPRTPSKWMPPWYDSTNTI